MSNRIRSNNVQLGQSFVLGQSQKPTNEKNATENNDEISSAKKELINLQNKKIEIEKQIEKLSEEAQEKTNLIIKEAENKAQQIIAEANEEVQKQLAEIEIIKQQELEQAQAAGIQQGLEEGFKQGREEIIKKTKDLDKLIKAVFDTKKDIIFSAEKEILDLSVLIAEKLLSYKLETEPELIKNIVKSAINNLSDKENIKIIINPELSQKLYDNIEELKASFKGMKFIKIIEDKTISADGVIVESTESRIDGRLQTQLNEITKNILNEFLLKKHSQEIPQEIEEMIQEKFDEESPDEETEED